MSTLSHVAWVLLSLTLPVVGAFELSPCSAVTDSFALAARTCALVVVVVVVEGAPEFSALALGSLIFIFGPDFNFSLPVRAVPRSSSDTSSPEIDPFSAMSAAMNFAGLARRERPCAIDVATVGPTLGFGDLGSGSWIGCSSDGEL